MQSNNIVHDSQFPFQKQNVSGRILNIGSNTDPSELKKLDAINVDVCEVDPVTKMPNVFDVLADARNLPETLYHKFDCVVLGEILEHMTDEDIIKTLFEAKCCLEDLTKGWIVITFPEEHRSLESGAQREGVDPKTEYAPGISAFHPRKITLEDMKILLDKANLGIQKQEEIHYPFDGVKGWGLVVKLCL